LTPEVAEAIVEAMRGGNYLETAAALAGISIATLRNWLRDGRRNLSP
jgi:transposase